MDGLIVGGGLLIDVLAGLLVYHDNPLNMESCIICFLRDIAGGLGLHRADVVQYLRPEIPDLLLNTTLYFHYLPMLPLPISIGKSFKPSSHKGEDSLKLTYITLLP